MYPVTRTQRARYGAVRKGREGKVREQSIPDLHHQMPQSLCLSRGLVFSVQHLAAAPAAAAAPHLAGLLLVGHGTQDDGAPAATRTRELAGEPCVCGLGDHGGQRGVAHSDSAQQAVVHRHQLTLQARTGKDHVR
jgi:hypothetical protein